MQVALRLRGGAVASLHQLGRTLTLE